MKWGEMSPAIGSVQLKNFEVIKSKKDRYQGTHAYLFIFLYLHIYIVGIKLGNVVSFLS